MPVSGCTPPKVKPAELQVWSPGGDWLATTTSAGAFTVVPLTPATNNSDFDNDGDVDGGDFLTWQKNLGSTGVPAGDKSTGDANGDGTVNGLDQQEWKDHYGLPPTVAAAGAVPEPASLALGVLAITGLSGVRRRR